MIALPPDCVRWVARNGEDNDCAISAISLALGLTYEQVLAEAVMTEPNALVEGLTTKDIAKVLNKLKVKYRMRRKFDDLDDVSGILIIEETRKKRKERHAVYLWEGRIIEPSMGRRSFWLTVDNYVKHEVAKPVWLFEIEREEPNEQ